MPIPRYPSLLQINTRVRLAELSTTLGRPATLDDVNDTELDQLARDGFDLVWLLGVWQTGEAGRRVSATNPAWLAEYRQTLPDFRDSDVTGSCFAIRDYRVHTDFGGDEALARLHARLHEHGLRLLLDFVPNHLAPDHPWVEEHPDFFIAGTEEQLRREPQNYRRLATASGSRILALGRDPYFAGWPDTLQLDHGNPALQDALLGELQKIARQCDGVRCDMAMLVLPEIFASTWGIVPAPFWPRAMAAVRAQVPGFLFLAEVYWDLEWTLLQQGFDYCYDKRLYDRLVAGAAGSVREHLRADLDFQDRLTRFLENHDEQRAAATFAPDAHRAAALVSYLSPGLRFFHQGQREGKRIRIPTHLGRGPAEAPDAHLAAFYDSLFACLREPAFRDGQWQLLETRPAWLGNTTNDAFIACSWTGPDDRRHLLAVNYANHRSQCYLKLTWKDLTSRIWRLADRLAEISYQADGDALSTQGLYLDMPAWGYHLFEVGPARDGAAGPP